MPAVLQHQAWHVPEQLWHLTVAFFVEALLAVAILVIAALVKAVLVVAKLVKSILGVPILVKTQPASGEHVGS